MGTPGTGVIVMGCCTTQETFNDEYNERVALKGKDETKDTLVGRSAVGRKPANVFVRPALSEIHSNFFEKSAPDKGRELVEADAPAFTDGHQRLRR